MRYEAITLDNHRVREQEALAKENDSHGNTILTVDSTALATKAGRSRASH